MRHPALTPVQSLLLTAASAALLAIASTSAQAQDDPPIQAARLSDVSGTVSIQPAGIDTWGQAYSNLSLGPGDRIYTDADGRAEVQVGWGHVRVGRNADLSVTELSDRLLAFGLARGSVHVHTTGYTQGQKLEIHTPNGAIRLPTNGDFRVDVFPDQNATVFTAIQAADEVIGAGGFDQPINDGQSIELVGTNPVLPQAMDPAPPDDLDMWSRQRDAQLAHVAAYQYVSPEVAGAADLDAAGDWQPGTEYGAVWFPRNLPGGWAPYHNGHWVNHAPWGWIWVEDESWGYAPFHYGRWVTVGGRWGWIPGPRNVHPVWSPALVVFAGGVQVGGTGVSAWFPLGPGEPYRPWYPCSPRYIDQVNISNILPSPRVHVQVTYVNIVTTNITYVNRSIGVTAMRHEDFASGHSAGQVSVKIDVNLMNHVTVLDRPEPKPVAASFVGRPAVRPVPVKVERPVLVNGQGKLVSAKPGAKPMEAPVGPKPVAPKPLPGHTVAAPAGGQKQPPAKETTAPGKPVTQAPPAKTPEAPAKTPPAKAPDVPVKTPPGATPAKPTDQPAPKTAAPPAKTPPASAPAKPVTQPAAPPAKTPPAATPAKPDATQKPAPKSDKDKKTDKDKPEPPKTNPQG